MRLEYHLMLIAWGVGGPHYRCNLVSFRGTPWGLFLTPAFFSGTVPLLCFPATMN